MELPEPRVVTQHFGEFCPGCGGSIFKGEVATAEEGFFDDEPFWMCPRCVANKERAVKDAIDRLNSGQVKGT